MLFLLFNLGDDRYALDVRQIVEVLPVLQLKCIPGAPPGVAGLLDYHGAPVPVIDLRDLTLGCSARSRISTRIVLVQYPCSGDGSQILGLIAERASEILRCENGAFTAAGVKSPEAPYLGPVIPHADSLVQRVEIAGLLPDSLRDLLFEPQAAAP